MVTGQCGLVEDLWYQTQILEDGDGLAVGGGDARGLLPSMLEGEETEVQEVGDALRGRVCGYDPAGLAGP